MPKRKYKDDEKERLYRNKQRKINYSSTSIYPRSCFTKEQDNLILQHTISDRELSKIIQHSVQSIQVRRSRLKKGKYVIMNKLETNVNQLIKNLDDCELLNLENISDGYHTFKELYEFRLLYNALYFNELYKNNKQIDVYKTKKHEDGNPCFDGNWFLVVAKLPNGKIIDNHYELKDWGMFKIPEVEKSKYKFDGHTSQDVVNNMKNFIERG